MRIFPLLALAGSLATSLPGQQPAAAEQPQAEPSTTIKVDVNEMGTIRVEVDVVNILCSVRDKKGRLIADLTQDDFVLFEDRTEQKIKYFARETNLPLTIGLLVDVSRSQENLIEVEKQASYRFFSQVLRKKDLAFLISFGAEAELLQDFTGSPDILREGLDELRLNAGVGGILPGPIPTGKQKGTILYDAVYLAAEDMLRGEVGRKVIVLISDGVDYGSTYSKSRAIEAAQKADAIIYSIYYADPRYQQYRVGYGDLKEMSEDTGGRIFRVSRRNTLDVIFDEIDEEMRSQYSLGYTPTNPEKDGTFRRVKIQTSQKGLRVQARKGYYSTPSSIR